MAQDTTNNNPTPSSDQNAVLKILEEKDKIIVSLKESSTQRDKLNEKQIRVLSEDNENKKATIFSQNEQLQQVERKFLDASSKLSVYQERFNQYSDKLEDLKSTVSEYKQSIASSLQQVSDLVSLELTKRDEKNEKLSGILRENYKKLENKLTQIDSQYKGIINSIAEKQVKAKGYIRQALSVLQEALNLLDINSTGLMVDNKLFDDFQGIIQDSAHAFSELSGKTRDAATIIKNIENVHIKLTTTPRIDSFMKEMKSIANGQQIPTPTTDQASTEEEIDLEQMFQEDMGGPSTSSAPASGGTTSAPTAPAQGINTGSATPGQSSTGPTPTPLQGGTAAPSAPSSPTQPPSPGTAGQPAPPQAFYSGMGTTPAQTIPFPSGQLSPSTGFQQPGSATIYQSSSGPAMATTQMGGASAAATALAAAPMPSSMPQTIKPEDDLVMRESPNLAPYNWDMLPSISPLLRFRRLLNNARRAEKKRNYVKALDIYEVIKQQRTIQDDPLALNILEDQIEALNRIARAQVSVNKKRDEVTKFIHLREEKHDS